MIKIAWDKVYCHPLPEGHRFPMEKYDLIPKQLLYHGIIQERNLFSPEPIDEYWVLKTHQEDYWQRLIDLKLSASEERRIGFPVSKELVYREMVICNGTILAAASAIGSGLAFNVAGGTHHAGYNWGEGFCLLNDIAIASNFLIEQNQLKRILVIDLDVHQGNGTAQIFAGNEKVFTLSVHGEKNFPFKKEKSDLDVGLDDGTSDDEYLNIVHALTEKVVNDYKPEFIFYQSGVDVLESDKLGKLKLTKEACMERDRHVFDMCNKMGIPVTAIMGGGYSASVSDIVDAHCKTFETGFSIFQ